MFDAERWRAGLLHTGHRAALLVSGDVVGGFEHVARSDAELAAALVQPPEELLAIARRKAEVVELVNFAVSDELSALNRRLGGD